MAGQTFVEADIWTVAQTDRGNVVLVRPKGSDLAVPIFIGQLETQSILIGLGRVEVPRPLSHDLMLSLMHTLDAELSRIEICDLRDGTFFARIILLAQGREIAVDSRPSDAIGIAVRALCPVFIAESVVEEAGISVNLVNGQSIHAGEGSEGQADTASLEQRRARLGEELEAALAEEDYERAAVLRDRLKELEKGM